MTRNKPEQCPPTRESLLSRLRSWDDQRSWTDFFETYWRLIYAVAIKAGLNDAEAQEVVQETVMTVARQMPNFEYDRRRGSFKGWLLQTTRWRISDQFRKRGPQCGAEHAREVDESGTAEIERVADPAPTIESLWDEAWERNLLDAALERVKTLVDPKTFQLFDLHVLREWPVREVADKMHTTSAHVYYAKYKVGRLLKKTLLDLAEPRRRPGPHPRCC